MSLIVNSPKTRIKFSSLIKLLIIINALILASCDKDEKPPESPFNEEEAVNPAASIQAPQYIEVDRDDIIKIKSFPNELNFGKMPVDSTTERTLGIVNTFAKPVTIKSVKLYGAENLYKISGGCNTDEVVRPQSQCELIVTYNPLDDTAHEGEILITYETGKPLSIKVRGQGISPSTPPPDQAYLDALKFAHQRQQAKLAIQQSSTKKEEETSFTYRDKLNEYPDDVYQNGAKVISTPPVDRARIITQDRYIPAVLENTINSELPGGRIIAVVERHVYGSDGRKILIPAGSRALGSYANLRKVGDSRLAVTWNRIIRPDGVSISLEADGTDPMGRLGLIGDVDRRSLQKYGGSILTSFLSVLPEYFFGEEEGQVNGQVGEGGIVISTGDNQNTSGKARATRQFSEDMSFLARRIIQENLQLQPIVTIPQGTRLLIVPSEDIYLIRPDQFISLNKVTTQKNQEAGVIKYKASVGQIKAPSQDTQPISNKLEPPDDYRQDSVKNSGSLDQNTRLYVPKPLTE